MGATITHYYGNSDLATGFCMGDYDSIQEATNVMDDLISASKIAQAIGNDAVVVAPDNYTRQVKVGDVVVVTIKIEF